MRQQQTEDEISNWVQRNYASTSAPSLNAAVAQATPAAPVAAPTAGMLGAATPTTPTSMAAPAAPAAASTPASTTSTWAQAASPPASTTSTPTSMAMPASPAMPTATAPAKAPAPNVNINNWYRNELGRDGDAAGVAYWQNRLDGGEDAQSLYSEFAKSAAANAEIVKPKDWASANTYTGPVSANASSIADEWSRNVLGRSLSTTEQAQWDAKIGSATSPAQGQAIYQEFLDAYGQGKSNVSLAQASQIAPAAASGANAAQIAKADLSTRTIDKPTETVQGQIGNVLAENSQVMQQARADAMRTAADRGMLNSAMAASGGEDAVIRSAAGIATTDAGAYNNAANYNVAAQNQATMWNADQVAQMQRLEMQQNADAAARAQQMAIAQMQDSTSRYQSEMSANTARYNSDASYRQQMDSQKKGLVNNIINNMDLSPDRKAAMLESLGEGTSATRNPDGSITPGTGLAGAAYVIDSVAADLRPGSSSASGGSLGGIMNTAAGQVAPL